MILEGTLKLNVKLISTELNFSRYLCEFIYYVSLTQDRKRTLFVHVPPLNQPFSKSQLTYCLEEILRAALELIEEEDRKCVCYPTDATKIYRNGRAAAF